MAKKVQATVKLQLPAESHAGAAGRHRARSARREYHGFLQAVQRQDAKEPDGMIIPVLVTIYSDRTFTFITKTPPASELLKRAAGIVKGSAEPNRNKVGKVTRSRSKKLPRPNCRT